MGVLGLLVMGFATTDISLNGVTFGVHSMIAGSLLTLVGYQVGSMGVFATIASDPIQRPNDAVTERLVESLTLERMATAGVLLAAVGATYAGWLVLKWVNSGFTALPIVTADIAAFTAIVIGVQTVFGAFFMSAVAQN